MKGASQSKKEPGWTIPACSQQCSASFGSPSPKLLCFSFTPHMSFCSSPCMTLAMEIMISIKLISFYTFSLPHAPRPFASMGPAGVASVCLSCLLPEQPHWRDTSQSNLLQYRQGKYRDYSPAPTTKQWVVIY